MHIQKTAALVSATLFLTSFTVLPALAIVAQPSQSRLVEAVATESVQLASPPVSVQDFTAPLRQSSLDDAERAARIVEPDHPASEAAPTPEPAAPAVTTAPTSAAQTPDPTPTLAAPDLAQSDEALSRGTSGLDSNPAAGPLVRMHWFGEAETVYARGDVATVIDLETGIRLQVQRTGGHNHADVETIDPAETAKLLQVAGGDWNWTRRPI
ncbi:MAG: hypothetical protein PHQ83_10920, partial [Eubacteriales bacterium]|nr:hypothetical protein [Eubacteriales bacterium]